MDEFMRRFNRLTETQQREREQKQEIEHEQRLAEIRTQSRALVWTGPADELLNAIKRFYELGWIKADDLADAISKASLHFVGPDGKPIISPASGKPAQSRPEPTKKISRREFVEPLLDAKGWSVLEWAVEANVDKATANDYLDNKTSPYRSTRLKLAKALGVPVEQLPK
jgi:lambda repressor-like predicted transcriptional regulator